MDNVLRWKPLSCGGGGGGSSKLVTGSDVGGIWELTEAQLCGCGVWGDENRTFTPSVLGSGHGAMLSCCRCHGWVTSGQCDQEASSCPLAIQELWLPASKNLGMPAAGSALGREAEVRLDVWHSAGSRGRG